MQGGMGKTFLEVETTKTRHVGDKNFHEKKKKSGIEKKHAISKKQPFFAKLRLIGRSVRDKNPHTTSGWGRVSKDVTPKRRGQTGLRPTTKLKKKVVKSKQIDVATIGGIGRKWSTRNASKRIPSVGRKWNGKNGSDTLKSRRFSGRRKNSDQKD